MLHRTQIQGLRSRTKELRQRVAQCLAESPFVGLGKVRFHINGSTVTLWGRVATAKQRSFAERCVAQVPGVDFVYNRLQVAQLQTTACQGKSQTEQQLQTETVA